MKPKYIVIFALAIAGFITVLAWADWAHAQTPKPPPNPQMPLTQVAKTPIDFVGWCGAEFVRFSFNQTATEIVSRIVWFSNDADSFRTSRAIYYHWYDQWYNLLAASAVPLVAKGESPTTFLEAPYPDAPNPAGFYRPYVYRGGNTLRLKGGLPSPVIVTIFLRANVRTCVIDQVIELGVG